MNDFAATARSIPELPPKAFKVLQTGDVSGILSARPTTAIAGAGTGLGQALLIANGPNKWTVLPTEGGHQPYAHLWISSRWRFINYVTEYIKVCFF